MTQDQIMALIRQIVPILAGLAIARGYSQKDVAQWSDLALQIAGPLLAMGGLVWAYIANRKTSIIKSASQMPEVDSKKLAAAISDPNLKQAASQAATPQQENKP